MKSSMLSIIMVGIITGTSVHATPPPPDGGVSGSIQLTNQPHDADKNAVAKYAYSPDSTSNHSQNSVGFFSRIGNGISGLLSTITQRCWHVWHYLTSFFAAAPASKPDMAPPSIMQPHEHTVLNDAQSQPTIQPMQLPVNVVDVDSSDDVNEHKYDRQPAGYATLDSPADDQHDEHVTDAQQGQPGVIVNQQDASNDDLSSIAIVVHNIDEQPLFAIPEPNDEHVTDAQQGQPGAIVNQQDASNDDLSSAASMVHNVDEQPSFAIPEPNVPVPVVESPDNLDSNNAHVIDAVSSVPTISPAIMVRIEGHSNIYLNYSYLKPMPRLTSLDGIIDLIIATNKAIPVETLCLAKQGLTQLPDGICTLQYLEELDVSGNPISTLSHSLLTFLKEHNHLKKINLRGCQVTLSPAVEDALKERGVLIIFPDGSFDKMAGTTYARYMLKKRAQALENDAQAQALIAAQASVGVLAKIKSLLFLS